MPKKPAPSDSNDKPTKGRPYGIYLNREMSVAIKDIADQEAGGSEHAVLQVAVKWFVREYKAGKIKLKKKTITRLELD